MSNVVPAQPTIGVYAGFWRRAFALLVDDLIIVGVALLSSYAVGHAQRVAPGTPHALMGVVVFVLTILYEPAFLCSSLEATPGKRLFDLRVTGLAGERLTFFRSLVRFLSKLISGLTLCVGYAMAAYTSRRQALHDMIAGTLVVRRGIAPEAIAAARPAPYVSGFVAMVITLAVVAFGPSGLGVLAGIAIPAYQTSVLRLQVESGLETASRYQEAVERVHAAGTDLRSITSEAIRVAGDVTNPYVREVAVSNGIVVIQFGGQAGRTLAKTTLLLVPTIRDDGSVRWICGHGAPEGRPVLPLEKLDASTTTPAGLLPPRCRPPARE
jgi:uncharacterized RDD family membrane protein YckC/Tfp pilus assembly major pilin PilA